MKKYEYYLRDQKLGFENGTEILKTLYPGRVLAGWPPITYAPEENEQLLSGLNDYGIPTERVEITANEYENYLSAAGYRKKYPDYYPENFYEKTFEHFLALKLLDPQKKDIFIDIGAEHSPHAEIFSRLRGCHGYMQDIMMKPGISGNKIGCDASAIPVRDSFFSSILAACAIEHFENESDIRFMTEVSRILKTGGRILILPLYLHEYPFYATDPVSSVPGEVRFAEDIKIHCVKDWGNRQGRFYSPRTLHDRLIGPHRQTMDFKVIHVNNFQRIHPSVYCRFALLGEKKS